MSHDPYRSSTQTVSSGSRVVDAGLQAYMQSVYRTMTWGLVVTGLTAYGVFSIPALFNMIFGTPLSWLVILAPLGFIWFGFSPAKVRGMSSEKLRSVFILFSAVMGLSMAMLFAIYTGASIARVFFITSAMFAATSLYGYTTKRDLTGMGSFMMMGLFGIIIAMVVNIFLGSAMVQFVISVLGVVIFTGLTAWETQRLRDIYSEGATEANAKMAVMGALGLYLNFINLFQFMLQFMGDRR